jgi:hypothetical protein
MEAFQMCGQSLRPEQLAAVAQAMELIDEALDRLKVQDVRTAVLLMRDAHEMLDAIRTGRDSEDR